MKIKGNLIEIENLPSIGNGKRTYDVWEITEKDLSVKGLHREGVLNVLKMNGFFRRDSLGEKSKLCKVDGNAIDFVSISDIMAWFKNYVFSKENGLQIKSNHRNQTAKIPSAQLKDVFLKQQNLIFNSQLSVLLESDDREELQDSSDTAYLLFKNCIISITAEDLKIHNYYDYLDKVFFKTQVIDFDYYGENSWKECVFAKFVKNIANNCADRKDTIRSALGYLLHNYNDVAKSQAIILYDEQVKSKNVPMGGTGKGIIGQAIEQIKRKGFKRVDGKGMNLNSQFVFQQVEEDTRVLFIDDVNKQFDIDRFNSVLTEGLTVEKKFKTAYHIPKDKMPKILISSNVILAFEGSTRERRQFVIELSDHYSSKIKYGTEQPIIEEHGTVFFGSKWSEKEWCGFYTFMIKCIQLYLRRGLVIPSSNNVKANYAKQRIGLEYYGWIDSVISNSKDEQMNLENLHQIFLEDFSLEKEEFSRRKLSDNIKIYLGAKGIGYNFKKNILTITKQ